MKARLLSRELPLKRPLTEPEFFRDGRDRGMSRRQEFEERCPHPRLCRCALGELGESGAKVGFEDLPHRRILGEEGPSRVLGG